MDGLIIKPEWLLQIYEPVNPFTEPKTWEIRGSSTSKRGRIYLLESGSGLVTGETTIADCKPINGFDDWIDNETKHQIPIDGYLYAMATYNRKVYAWVFKDTVKYAKPMKYMKPKGAIIWVKNVENLIINREETPHV